MKKTNKLLAAMCAAMLTAASLTAIPTSAMAGLSEEKQILLSARMAAYGDDSYTVETANFRYQTGWSVEIETDALDLSDGIYSMISGLLYENDAEPDTVTNVCLTPISYHLERSILYNIPQGLDLSMLRVGDIYRADIDDYVAIERIPPQVSMVNVERIGAGEEIFGTEFRKVIRHEFLSDKTVIAPDDTATASIDFVRGDVAEDDEVDIVDAISLNKYLLGSRTVTCYQSLAADVDQSGNLDETDSLMLLKEVVGITTNFEEQ